VGASKVDAWKDLRVGDRVRVFVLGAQNIRPDVFDLVELWLSEDALSPATSDPVAVLRGADGELETMSARMLRKLT
jgi:hypothetical protein